MQFNIKCIAQESETISCDYYISINMESVVKNTIDTECAVKRVSFTEYNEKYYYSNIPYPLSGTMSSLFERKSADLLCNDFMIKEKANEQGIENIERLERYFWYSYINGFLVKIFDENNKVYFLCILRDGDKYGLFENMKIYTSTEFLNLCVNEGWQMEIKGLKYTVGADFEKIYIPLRVLLEAIGCDVVWNTEEQAVEFGNFKVIMSQTNDEYYRGKIYLNDKPFGSPTVYPNNTFILKNDRFYFFETAVGSFDTFLQEAYNIKKILIEII